MKNIFIALIALLTLASCNQSKVGYADTAKIMEEYKAVKDIKKEIEEKNKTVQAKYEKLYADFQNRVAEYQKNVRSYSQATAQKKGEELQQMEQKIQNGYQVEGSALDKESKERLQTLVGDIKSFTEDFAKSKGYTFVLGSEKESFNILYGDKKNDLTDDLIEALNTDYKAGSSKAEKIPEDIDSAEAETAADTTATK